MTDRGKDAPPYLAQGRCTLSAPTEIQAMHETPEQKAARLVGSEWATLTGNTWRIIASDGDRIHVERTNRHPDLPPDRHWWNIRSITHVAEMRRLS